MDQGGDHLKKIFFLCLKHAHCYCWIEQGLVNVLIEHHPTIGDIITNKYLEVMFKIPKTGHLPTPVESLRISQPVFSQSTWWFPSLSPRKPGVAD